MMKQCSKCKKWFLPEEINKKGICKICVRDYDWVRRRHVTPEQYAKMFNLQKGRCAVCGKSYKDEIQMLAVDHDHTTNAVRGLLCRNCNVGIGLFKENPSFLLAAYFYLKGIPMEDYTDNLVGAIDVLSDVMKELKTEIAKLKTVVESHTKELEFIRKSY